MTYMTPVLVVVVSGLIIGILLTIAAKVFAVLVDERVSACREALPGANCGACGFAGCDDYANACVDGGTALNLCPVGGPKVAEALGEILGVSVDAAEGKFAEVRCMGTCDRTKPLMDYDGVKTCKAAKQFFGGSGSCASGCMGFGDCVDACAFDAIGIVDGVAWVDRNNCVGCEQCVKACPNNLIAMAPSKNLVYVACSSTDKAADTMKVCKVGCIACGKCVKACKFDAIVIENNHAIIDPVKCTNCGMCVKECPRVCILKLPKPPKK